MSHERARIPLQTWARVAGLGYLVIIGTGIFAEFAVRSSLIVPGDAAATAANIVASETLFRFAIAAELVMLTADVLLAGALYVLFRDVADDLAMLAAFFRLTHAAVVGANVLNTHMPLLLLGAGAGGALASPEALAAVFLGSQAYGYAVGLFFFAAHCLLLGVLVLRSALVPRVLGVLLLCAAAGYASDTLGRTLLADYADRAGLFGALVLVPALVAELSFSLWLTFKGVREPDADAA